MSTHLGLLSSAAVQVEPSVGDDPPDQLLAGHVLQGLPCQGSIDLKLRSQDEVRIEAAFREGARTLSDTAAGVMTRPLGTYTRSETPLSLNTAVLVTSDKNFW
jgi:hypothetical protein